MLHLNCILHRNGQCCKNMARHVVITICAHTILHCYIPKCAAHICGMQHTIGKCTNGDPEKLVFSWSATKILNSSESSGSRINSIGNKTTATAVKIHDQKQQLFCCPYAHINSTDLRCRYVYRKMEMLQGHEREAVGSLFTPKCCAGCWKLR